MVDERVAIFIDGANLLHALSQDFDRIDIDFPSLVTKLVDERRLVRTYYYTALPGQELDPERYKRQQKFLDALERKPYFTVVLGRLERRATGYVEKGVDISLAVDMLDLAYNDVYDTAILLSGDGDFARAVEVVKRLGKHVENASTRSCLSFHLRKTCDKTIIMDTKYLKDCWRHTNHGAGRMSNH